MAREQPGAIIVDQLRDRIVTGIFLGNWRPGERLPSIRDVAEAEGVDRKTAAAAYRRLEEEGLVRVRARSGVYLRPDAPPRLIGPLERLHLRWLRNTYESGRDLGLDTPTMLRLLHAIAEVETAAVPVIDADMTFAEQIADELRTRAGVRAVAVGALRGEEAARAATFAVTTPYQAATLPAEVPAVEATLSTELLEALRRTLARGRALILVPSELLATKLRRGLAQGQLQPAGADAIVQAWHDELDLGAQMSGIDAVLVWPGTAAGSAQHLARVPCERPRHVVSEECLRRVRLATLDAAMRRLNGAAETPVLSIPTGDGVRGRVATLAARPARPSQGPEAVLHG
ncbi:MAG TPA: GntR family transcriptional regulator [Longimicrobiales bacterium]|nr:GntR family transcriptional regulator [Longimicrobiales bacterium]